MRPTPLLLVAVTAAAFTVGCGGELTAQQFTSTGNAICRDSDESAEKIQARAPFTEADAVDQLERLLELAETEQRGLGDLNGPQSQRAALERYLAARGQAIELMRRGLERARKGDARGYERLRKQLARGQHRRARLADAVGFDDCSRAIPARYPGD